MLLQDGQNDHSLRPVPIVLACCAAPGIKVSQHTLQDEQNMLHNCTWAFRDNTPVPFLAEAREPHAVEARVALQRRRHSSPARAEE